MSLRSATLLAAIAQTLSALFLLIEFVFNLQELHWAQNWRFLVSMPVYIFADASLAIFMFTLFNRQKKE